MPGLVPGIHAFARAELTFSEPCATAEPGCAGFRPRSAPSARKSWMAGTGPAMTGKGLPEGDPLLRARHARARPGHPRLRRGRARLIRTERDGTAVDARAPARAVRLRRASRGWRGLIPGPSPGTAMTGRGERSGEGAKPRSSRRRVGAPRHVAAAGEEARDGDIFVEVFPVQPEMADLDPLAVGRTRVEQAREPGERHAYRAPVRELDPHRRIIKPNRRRRNGHAQRAAIFAFCLSCACRLSSVSPVRDLI